jgi:peptidoglycan-N-acetylglucosamine deacetylase
MVLRLLITAVISIAGFSGGPTEYFPLESMSPTSEREEDSSSAEQLYFDETGQYLRGELLEFWLEYGGLPVFGFPVSDEIEQNDLTVQYFERAVLELHPDDEPDWRVQLRRLGEDASGPEIRRNGAFNPDEDRDSLRYFPETSQVLDNRFYGYWDSHGGVRIFGYPISSEFEANGIRYQYFERSILEYHEDNPSGWRILQPHLGSEAAEHDGVDTSPQPHDGYTQVFEQQTSGRGAAGLGERVVYLTFDDGPHKKWTPQILDILADYDALGTFFVLGKYANSYPELIDRIAKEGHTLANHGYDHSSMAGMSRDQLEWQLAETERAVGNEMAGCMRPPYGAMDGNTEAWSAELGYEVILWDVDPRDWQRPGVDVIADRILAGVSPGDVVLLHDGGGDRSQSVEALKIVLEELDSQGYRFKPLCQ